jgi:hypothetical protein
MPALKTWLVLLVDGGIRWHSTFEMINRVLILKDVILRWQRRYTYVKGVDIRLSFLSIEDFEILEIWASILKDFKQLCLEEEANPDLTTQGTAAGVIQGLTYIYDRLQHAKSHITQLYLADSLAKPFIEGLKEATAKTMKYLALIEETPLYYAAIFLDPNLRLIWFEDKWAPYDNRKWYKRAESGIKLLFDEYSELNTVASPSPSPLRSVSEDIEDFTLEPERRTAYSQFNRLSAKVLTKKRKVATKEDDYTRYTKYWDPTTWSEVTNIIEWWSQHQNEFPILLKMAFDILSIPGMSAEVERIFSAAGRLVTDSRNGLKDDTIEACQVQHHGLKNGLFNVI